MKRLLLPVALWSLVQASVHGAAEPVVAPAFTPLPLGQVEPQGWLRDWAVAARDGITGQLDERHVVFRDGWKGTPVKWTGAGADGTGWPLEQSAYWLDGAIRLGYLLHDDALIRKVRARLDPVVDGILRGEEGVPFAYWKGKNWQPHGFDSWAHSHMGRALLGLYSGSGEQRVLDALVKAYAHYPENMGAYHLHDVTGICNIDPMLETYALSGDRRVLARALAGTNTVHAGMAGWGKPTMECGHLVITYENIRIPSVLYPWTGNQAELDATLAAARWLEDNHMMPYGVPSGEEYVARVGAGRKTETCDIPAMLLAYDRLYRILGDGSFGDRMEKAFFNAGPSPISRDFKTAAYYQAPNRIKLGVLPTPAHHKESIYFGPLASEVVLCCIGACNRILPQYIPAMWMATPDHGLAATLYGPCTVNAHAGSRVPVKIECATDYPFNESIRMKVTPESPVEFPLYLRLPGWCAAPRVEVNGEAVAVESAPGRKGFARIARRWSKGDAVTLRLPMSARLVRGTDGAYPSSIAAYFMGQTHIPASAFIPRALPYAYLDYGPLLFCLPIPEKDDNNAADGAKYGYALDLMPAEAGQLAVARKPMPAHWDWPYDAPLALEVPVRPFDWSPTLAQPLPDKPVTGGKRETVRLIPYGCSKFHISMFPVTPRTWEGMVMPKLPRLPELLGGAGPFEDAASTEGAIVAFINAPGCGAAWRGLPAGKKVRIRYAAPNAAQLTLRINDGAPARVKFPATGKWFGEGAYAVVTVPAEIPQGATLKLAFEPGDVPANIDSLEIEP